MKKTYLFILVFAICGVALAISQSNNYATKLYIAQQAIKELYIEDVDMDKLTEEAIKGMLEQLDPHSAYSNAEETKELNEPLQGNFSGIGITFNMAEDTLYVIQTVAGGPSERVGLLAGDRIIAVNDTSIAGQKMKNNDVIKRLRGPKGTEVDITVLRGPETIDFTIIRDDIPIYSVDASYMVDPSTGYIRVSRFAAETGEEVRKALKELKSQGMENLILDLTDNGGGYLQSAVEILGEFLDPGNMTVYTEGLHSPRRNFYAQPEGNNPLMADGKLVVMLNQYSASASEITAGAIQDWDRGVIVGRRSFGKGLVQQPIPLPDGSMIRLTTAHYYTPTGRDIQKPYEKGNSKSYDKDMAERFDHGELMHEDSIKYVDSLKVQTLKSKRDIYGGGGIYPDKFVPLDTSEYTKYYRNVMAKGLFNKFAIQFVDKNRAKIKAEYKTDDDYVENFDITPEMLNTLKEMADKEGIEFNQDEFDTSAPLFKMILKALIGRDIYENATYFKVYNSHDPIFKEAVNIINSPDFKYYLGPGPVILKDKGEGDRKSAPNAN